MLATLLIKLCVAVGCETTAANEALMCVCGKHSARFDPGKGKKATPKWQVMCVQRVGQAPRPVTTAAKKEKVLQCVRELCAGTHKSQVH